METTNQTPSAAMMQTLPGDAVRQIMWRFEDRFDYQMLIQSTRAVARGPVARLVAEGGRNSHEWTAAKNELIKYYDESGITSAFLDPEFGGYIEGPKNFVTALTAFELAWVDGGAATGSLAGNLALAPIHERGTYDQRKYYMSKSAPSLSENGVPWHGAFALTEPLPFVGVDTGVLSGKLSVAEWKDGEEPMLQVEKRGRFITNMGYANFVTAAVGTADPRIKSSCMVILEQTDPGIYDRGVPTKKLVHQLSSTNDPVFSLKIPASRIIGGYTVKDGVIVPNFDHSQVIEAVFHRTRVPVALMSAAKLLSAVEPVIRYQRQRFRGGDAGPGTPRFDLGLQMKEDASQRLADVWATGEAASSLGFATARLFDVYDGVEKRKNEIFAEQGIAGRAQLRAFRKMASDAVELIGLEAQPEDARNQARYEELKANELVQFMILDAQANVLCPACKLWNCGWGATMMREAVSLMGGYGITEDCPGFLCQKWSDAQLEATYEGPEVVQRRQLSITMTTDVFLAQWKQWIVEMRKIAAENPGTGACTLATAMTLWQWTIDYLMNAKDANGETIYQSKRHGVSFPMADAISWLLAARQLTLDVLELKAKAPSNATLSEGAEGLVNTYIDLCHAFAARAASEVGRIASELMFGYNAHPAWTDEPAEGACCCGCNGEPDVVAEMIPELSEGGCCSAPKAGPCVSFAGVEPFLQLRIKLDGCLSGSRLAKDRVATALTQVMIPEALDYPV
ncbi:MAG: acyl-CoA dehydrogenase family protein [Candidatus Sumerlaeia bacterium]